MQVPSKEEYLRIIRDKSSGLGNLNEPWRNSYHNIVRRKKVNASATLAFKDPNLHCLDSTIEKPRFFIVIPSHSLPNSEKGRKFI